MMKNKEKIKEENRRLIEKYPFLAIKAYNFDNDCYYIPDDYDYSVTWLEGLPKGWVEAFGEQMCEEMKQALEEYDYVDKYIITETKEKYGQLRIYDDGIPRGCRVWGVIQKYTDLSEKTCCSCGKPATKISLGWIDPWCDECASKLKGKFVDIKDDPMG